MNLKPNLYGINGEKYVVSGNNLYAVGEKSETPALNQACLFQGRVVAFSKYSGPDVKHGMYIMSIPGEMGKEKKIHISDIDELTVLEYIGSGDIDLLAGGEIGQEVAEMISDI